jgi:hypothetical protein
MTSRSGEMPALSMIARSSNGGLNKPRSSSVRNFSMGMFIEPGICPIVDWRVGEDVLKG